MIKFKNILRLLVTGSFTMLLSACYGVMMPFSAKFKVTNSDGIGIPELKITYKDSAESTDSFIAGTTDDFGRFRFNIADYGGEDFQFKIEDIDGYENLGKFITKYVNLDDDLENIAMNEE